MICEYSYLLLQECAFWNQFELITHAALIMTSYIVSSDYSQLRSDTDQQCFRSQYEHRHSGGSFLQELIMTD